MFRSLFHSLKPFLKAYSYLPSVERSGLAALSILLVLLLTVRCGLHCFVHPETDPMAERRLRAQLDRFLADAAPEDDALPARPDPVLFPFDPNTLDSAGFVRLGLPARTAHGICAWRAKGKIFRSAEEFSKVYTLDRSLYERLRPYIRLPAGKQSSPLFASEKRAPVDINSADSLTLLTVRGIGPALASRILRQRALFGGIPDEQVLKDCLRIPDSSFARIGSGIRIDASRVPKIRINGIGEAELARYPILGEELARRIVQYRMALGGFRDKSQLRLVPLMNGEIYRKIAPYISIE